MEGEDLVAKVVERASIDVLSVTEEPEVEVQECEAKIT